MTSSDSGHSPDGDGMNEIFLTARKRAKRIKDTGTSVDRSLELLHQEMIKLKNSPKIV